LFIQRRKSRSTWLRKISYANSFSTSYLIQNEYVQMHIEDRRLATLCMKYLTFECFDSGLSEESMQEFAAKGIYAFQDYAIVHWIDHLEAVIKSPQGFTYQEDDLAVSFTEFYESCRDETLVEYDTQQEYPVHSQHTNDSKDIKEMVQLCNYARKIRNIDQGLTALGRFGQIVRRSRSILEELSQSMIGASKEKIQEYYGNNCYRCPYHGCFYFHEGFPGPTRRDAHVDDHESPFYCTEESCPRSHSGFGTDIELSKHVAIMHPDRSIFASLLPKVKKSVIKHRCNICLREFTRARSLQVHVRIHDTERPYSCNFCEKSFVRKNDCERHERSHSKEEAKVIGDHSGEVDAPA